MERLLQFGKLLSSVVAHPGFPDTQLAAMVLATQQMLQDKLLMWHGNMTQVRQEKILAAVFHES